jgi:broad specificity phosphatase PhoE/ribonuclease HI
VVRLVVEADGGSRGNPGPAGYGALVKDADTGELLAEVAAGIGRATNNVAEYRGMIAGLEAATAYQPESVEVRMDSKLVVEQMAGRWKVKHPDMAALKAEADEVVRRLPRVRFTHMPRAMNSHADRLANEAMDAAARGEEWVRGPAPEPTRRAGAGPAAVSTVPGWSAVESVPTTLVLLRHGQTAQSVEKRFSGVSDPELTELGRAQAAAGARRVAELAGALSISAVYTSPLRRALATAELAAGALGLTPVVEPRLRETDFGAWEGCTFVEVRERSPAELDAWLASSGVAPPGGESFDQTLVRVRRTRGELLAAHPGEAVLLVTHVGPIKTLLRLALDAGPAVLHRIHLDLASVCIVDWYADGPAVVRLVNDTSHLGPQLVADGVTTPTAEPVSSV